MVNTINKVKYHLKKKNHGIEKVHGTDCDEHGDRGNKDGHGDGHWRTLETSMATVSDG